jgi:hypothetical protein
MPHVIWHIGGGNSLGVLQALIEDPGIGDSLLVEALQLLELLDAYGGGYVRHPVVVADHDVLVPGLLAVVPQESDLFCNFVAVRGHHTAFPGGHVLGRVEAVARAGADSAHFPAFVYRSVRLAGVLYDRDGLLAGELHNLVHFRRQAEQVDRQDGLGFVGYGIPDACRVDVEGPGIDVCEDGRCPAEEDGSGAADVRLPAEAGGLHPIGAASLPPPEGGGLLSDEDEISRIFDELCWFERHHRIGE